MDSGPTLNTPAAAPAPPIASPPALPPRSAPQAPPAVRGARPLHTGLWLLTPLVWVLLAGLVAVAALVAAARWVLLTDEGTAWLIARLPMVTEARGVQGALLGPRWQVERLRVQWDKGRQWLMLEGLVSEGMAWTWRPQGKLDVQTEGTATPASSSGLSARAGQTAKRHDPLSLCGRACQRLCGQRRRHRRYRGPQLSVQQPGCVSRLSTAPQGWLCRNADGHGWR